LAGLSVGHSNDTAEVMGLSLTVAAGVAVSARRSHVTVNAAKTATSYSAELKKQTGEAYPIYQRLQWNIDETGAFQNRTLDMRLTSRRYNTYISSRAAITSPVTAYLAGSIVAAETLDSGNASPLAFVLGAASCAAAIYGETVGEKYFSYVEEITGYMMDNAEGTSFKA
jgi:hypothetical protein